MFSSGLSNPQTEQEVAIPKLDITNNVSKLLETAVAQLVERWVSD